MKTKLEMAHEFMLAMIKAGCHDGPDLLDRAWKYADAMQAEADKRAKKCDEKIEINMYPEWDASINYPPDAWVVYRGEKRLAISIKDEWQLDWSQAPEWYSWWAMDEDRKCHWFSKEPNLVDGFDEWILGNNGEGLNNTYSPSIHCDYKGDWRDSLRKRPN